MTTRCSGHPELELLVERGITITGDAVLIGGVMHRSEECARIAADSAGPSSVTQLPRTELGALLRAEHCDPCLLTLYMDGPGSSALLRTWVSWVQQAVRIEEETSDLRAAAPYSEVGPFLHAVEELGETLESPNVLALEGWHEEHVRRREEALLHVLGASRALVEEAFVLQMLEESVVLPDILGGIEMAGVEEAVLAALASARRELLSSASRVLVALRSMRREAPSALSVMHAYYRVRPGVLLVPLALMPVLRTMRRYQAVEDVLVLEEVPARTLEAFTALYEPSGNGAFTTLSAAWEAAGAL